MGFSIGDITGSWMNSKRMGTTTERSDYTPSAWDVEKGKTLNMLRSILFPSLTSDLAGATTSKSQGAADAQTAKGVYSGAAAGLGSGDINLFDSMSKSMGKNNNAMSMAMQLYGYQPKISGSYSVDSDQSNYRKLAAIISLGKSGYNAYKSFDTPKQEQYNVEYNGGGNGNGNGTNNTNN